MSLYLGQVESAAVLHETLERWHNKRVFWTLKTDYSENHPNGYSVAYEAGRHPNNCKQYVAQVYR